MTGIPLPPTLTGTEAQRVIVIDDALLYLVTGALVPLVSGQVPLVETGTLTTAQAVALLSEMFEGLKMPLQLDFWRILPVGTILPAPASLNFGANFGKVLACDGSVYNSDDYPALATILSGGLPVFQVPDLRDRFLKGQAVGESALATGGQAQVTLTSDQIPSHSHVMNLVNSGQLTAGYGLPVSTAFENRPVVQQAVNPRYSTNTTGGGQAHENRPPYTAVQFWMIARND